MLQKIVAGLLVLVMLGSAVMPAMAAGDEEEYGCRACEITLKRVVEVDVAKNGKPILNITEINKSLNDWFSENFNFSCADGSCLTFDYHIEVNEVLNKSAKGKELKFLEIRIYNDTTSHEFKLLGYFSETTTYNLSLVTRIMEIDGENYFITTINAAPKDDKKFAPFADIIEVKSKTTLADHYRILAKVLNEIRKSDETSWVWNKAKNELNYLSRVVERELGEYNVEGQAIALIVDDYSACSHLCSLPCSLAITSVCAVLGGGWIGAVVCAFGSAVLCGAGCDYACGEDPNWINAGCSGGCSLLVYGICLKAAPFAVSLCQKAIEPIFCPQFCSLVNYFT